VVTPNDTAYRLRKGSVKIGVPVVVEQAAQLHYFVGKYAVCGIPSEKFIGIAGRGEAALVIEGRLLGKLLPFLKFMPPFGAYLDNIPGKFVADDYGISVNILRTAFVLLSLP
jgi:hypothetical protein